MFRNHIGLYGNYLLLRVITQMTEYSMKKELDNEMDTG